MNEETKPIMADEVEPVEEAVETEGVLENRVEPEEDEGARKPHPMMRNRPRKLSARAPNS